MRFGLNILLVLFLITSVNFYGQSTCKFKIVGSVMDESTGRQFEFVNISLVSVPDSSIVAGTTSNKAGTFELDNIPAGNYFLRFSFIGYKKVESKNIIVNGKENEINVGTISMKPEEINLDEVTVTSNKIMLSNSIDRKTYNVQQDVLSKTGSASDLLQNIPSVQVDIDGNVSLRGSTNVLILINGKNSPLMGKTRSEVLQTMPANSIDKIEVITNPSAKYKPDGTAGIINIILKKDSGRGLNGSVTGNLGNQGRYNGNINFNYNPGDLNIFGRYSVRKDNRMGFSYNNRTQFDEFGNPYHNNDTSNSNSKPLSHGINFGFDYNYDKSNSFGASGNYFYRGFIRNDRSNQKSFNASKMKTGEYDRLRYDDEYEEEYGVAAYAEHNFKEEDHKIRFDFNLSKSPEVEDNHYTNIYKLPASYLSYDNLRNGQNSDDVQATLEYSKPLSETSMLEAGYEGEFNKKDLNYKAELFSEQKKQFEIDLERTSHFAYEENINAVYATYSNKLGDLGFLGGVRLENARLNSNLISTGVTYKNKYNNIFPTLHLSYNLGGDSELQLNYSKRANRPEDDALNPFPEYEDPRNIRAGNPNLKPEFIHSIEFGYQWQNDNLNIVPSIFYRNKYNGFSTVTKAINDSVLLTTNENLATDQSAGVEFVLSSNVGNFLSANLSANAYYEQIDASNIGFGSKKSTVTWSGNLSCNVNFTNSTMMQVNSNFRSSRLTPQGNQKPSFVVNLGMRQDLLDDKLSLILTVSDLFNSLKRETIIDTYWLAQNSIGSRSGRIIYLGATYRFGNVGKKSKDKAIQYENGI